MSHDRGVTEVLGYVMVISIVTLILGAIMTLGFTGLQSTQQAEQTNNMERAFEVLADNLQEITLTTSPSRSTELRLQDGHITYGEEVTVNATVGDTVVGNLTARTDPIVFNDEQDTSIAYSAGAVLRRDGDASVMLEDPAFSIGPNRTVIPVVRTRGLAGSADRQDGPGTFMVRADALRTTRVTDEVPSDGTNVNITVSTPRPNAWQDYFSDMDVDDASVTTDGNDVTLTLTRDIGYTVTLIRQRLRISFQK